MDAIKLREITSGDVYKLQQIGKQTFSETFSESNTEANLQEYLEHGFSLEKLTSEVRDPNTAFYFAELGTEIIGYLKLNFGTAQTETLDPDAVEIERIYVRKDFHGKQVGQLLCDYAIHIASQRRANYIWLGVWEENPRAIRFYQKNGFVAFDTHIFTLGDDAQTDILMKRQL